MLATLSALLAEAAEKKETVNPVLPTTNEIVYGAIFFVLLLVFMWAVCLPPIKKAMRQRDEQVQADLEAAERANAEAEQVRRDYDATLAEARAEAARIVEEARHAADVRRGELIGVGSARMTATARSESGTLRASPFLVSGRTATRLRRSMRERSRPTSSLWRMPVSIASWTIGSSCGFLASRQAARRRASSPGSNRRSRARGIFGRRTRRTGFSGR